MVADYDLTRAQRTVDAVTSRHAGESRFRAAQVDASDAGAVAALAREVGATHVFNAVDPRFVLPIFEGAKAAGADYLDMAMSLSSRHPSEPYAKVGVKLGDDQLAQAGEWEADGRLALVGIGVEPGLSDVFARYAADHLFSHIDELGTRDGANLVIRDEEGNEVFAPGFSMWTIIEECLNPPVVWERERAVGADGSYDVEAGFFTLPPFAEPEVFDFPGGIGPVECVHVEHEEVLLMPRWVEADKVTFKYGLGEEMISHPAHPAHPRPGRHRPGDRQGRAGQPARRRGRRAARPRHHRPAHGGQDLRRAVGDRHRQGRPAAPHLPLPRVRQRRHDARLRRPVRRLADRRQPGRGAGAARGRHLERARACSARRPSTPCRSSTCSPPPSPRATARPGASRTAEPGLG